MRRHLPVLAVILLAVAHGATMAGAPKKLLPVDEAASDPAFFIFRARLIEAVATHDTARLLAVLSPKIQNNFGGDGGIEEFKQQWQPDGKESKLWQELGRALSLGGKFSKDHSFAAPYYFAAWPEDDSVDAFEWVAIIGENIRVREKADANSAVIGRLSFELVHVEEQQDAASDEWTKIKLADGRKGFVASRFTGSGIGWRAAFAKENGEWRMTAFVAGD
ncbi:MAG: SH3 domain-containing protein [Verrucomicrobiaceae bacterium]|nr:SH3 domain-containing protein [Verrucomicrobiaceae bacterium]